VSSYGLPGILPADTNVFNLDEYSYGHRAPEEEDDGKPEDSSDYDTIDDVDQEEITKKGESWIPGSVLFKRSTATLGSSGKTWLDEQIPYLRSGTSEIEVLGHAWKECGDSEAEMRLSLRRAYVVIAYLHELGGVPLERMHADGYGRYRPLAEGKNDPGVNRRVSIKLIKKGRIQVK